MKLIKTKWFAITRTHAQEHKFLNESVEAAHLFYSAGVLVRLHGHLGLTEAVLAHALDEHRVVYRRVPPVRHDWLKVLEGEAKVSEDRHDVREKSNVDIERRLK